MNEMQRAQSSLTVKEAWSGENAHVWAYDSSDDDGTFVEPLSSAHNQRDGPRSAAENEVEGLGARVQTTKAGQASIGRGRANLRALFNSMDLDNRGSIDRMDIREALKNNPRVREFLGLPAEFEKGSVWHAAFEAVFQCFDTVNTDGGRITWPEFVGRHKEAQALIKATRPKLTLTEIREKVMGVWQHLDPYEAGIVPRVDLERDLMEMAHQIPSVRSLYDVVEARDAMVVDEDDWDEDLEAWMIQVECRQARTHQQEVENGAEAEKPGQEQLTRLEAQRIAAEAEANRLQEEAVAAEKVAEVSEPAGEAHTSAKKAWQVAAKHSDLVSRLRQAEDQARRKAEAAAVPAVGSVSMTLRFEAGGKLGLGFAKRGTGELDRCFPGP